MTDDSTTVTDEDGDEDEDADGFVLVHQPTEHSLPYGVGPFPPLPGLAQELIDNRACDCENVAVLWVTFPKGVRLMIEADPDRVAAAVMSVLGEEEADGALPN